MYKFQAKQQELNYPDDSISKSVKDKIRKFNKQVEELEKLQAALPQQQATVNELPEGHPKRKKEQKLLDEITEAIADNENYISDMDDKLVADFERLHKNKDFYAAQTAKFLKPKAGAAAATNPPAGSAAPSQQTTNAPAGAAPVIQMQPGSAEPPKQTKPATNAATPLSNSTIDGNGNIKLAPPKPGEKKKESGVLAVFGVVASFAIGLFIGRAIK